MVFVCSVRRRIGAAIRAREESADVHKESSRKTMCSSEAGYSEFDAGESTYNMSILLLHRLPISLQCPNLFRTWTETPQPIVTDSPQPRSVVRISQCAGYSPGEGFESPAARVILKERTNES